MNKFAGEDIIDVREVIERFEALRDIRDYEEQDEFESLESLLEELKGDGGNVQWEGEWYPDTLIHDSYFQDYAQELAEDVGAINADATWPNNCIDWEQAARKLKYDYTGVEFDGHTYWYR